jgi:hypothetical protein
VRKYLCVTDPIVFTMHALTWLSLALLQVYFASVAASAMRVQSAHTASVEMPHGALWYRPTAHAEHGLHVSGVAALIQPAALPRTRKKLDAHSLIRESDFVVQVTPDDACATAVQREHTESVPPHSRETYLPAVHWVQHLRSDLSVHGLPSYLPSAHTVQSKHCPLASR